MRCECLDTVGVAGRSVGVEEEFLLVDPANGQVKAVGAAVLLAADDTSDMAVELQREQIETGTRPARDLAALGRELRPALLDGRERTKPSGRTPRR